MEKNILLIVDGRVLLAGLCVAGQKNGQSVSSCLCELCMSCDFSSCVKRNKCEKEPV